MAVNIGPRIGIDGEAEYRAQINNIIQQAKTLDAEMKAVTASFNGNTTAEEKNAAVSKILSQQLDVQKQRMSETQNMLEKSADKFGENATETLKWKEVLNNTKASISSIENQIDSLSNEVDDSGESFEKASTKAVSFGDVLKANVLSKAVVSGVKAIAGTIKDLSGDMLQAAANVKAQASQFEQTFGGIGDGATQFGDEAKAAISAVASECRILDTRLNGAATSIYAFTRANGGNQQESMELMETALRTAADSAAYYDKSLEETTETLQSFMKGNYSNDAALGVSATEFTRNAKATELFGKKFNDLSEIQKQQTLLQMVVDSQKVSGAMGQAAREADGWENVQGNLNETFNQFLAKVGTPILEQLIPIIQNITLAMQNWMQSFDWEYFNFKVNEFVTFFTEYGSEIIAVITAIGAGFVTWNVVTMIQGIITAVKGFTAANEGLTIAQAALNLVMAANPIGIVITAIMAAVAAITVLWNTNEDFRNFLIDAWNTMCETVTSIVKTITETFSNLIKSAFNWGKDFIQGIIDGIKSMIGSVKNAICNVAETITSYIHFTRPDVGPLHEYEKWMPDFMQGLAKGIKSNEYLVKNAISGLASDMSLELRGNTPTVFTRGSSAGGITVEKIYIQGYSHAEGKQLANAINRELGRLYG